jgi:hypothetical protein
MAKKNVHVSPHPDGGWQVKRDGAQRASSRHRTQSEAAEIGRETARREHGELFIHRPDGTIRDRDSYGNDPFPPRDRRH